MKACFLSENLREIYISLVILIVVSQAIYHALPLYAYHPDVVYIKGKVLEILQGKLFTDPVTGCLTFHPPWYHLLLAPFAMIGIDLNHALVLVSIVNVILTFGFVYRIITTLYNRDVAFYACLLLPFISDHMGYGNMLLATSFYFSLWIFLAGLYVYVMPSRSHQRMILAGVLWGIAFLISPVYLFFIGLIFIYEAVFKRSGRLALTIMGLFGLTIIPFMYQAYVILSNDMLGSGTFALWRGVPDSIWLLQFAKDFIRPLPHEGEQYMIVFHGAFLVAGLIIAIKKRAVPVLVIIGLLATILTYYHFKQQYAIRIQFLFSIFLLAMVIHYLTKTKIKKWIWYIPMGALCIMAIAGQQKRFHLVYDDVLAAQNEVQQYGRGFHAFFQKYHTPHEFIFCPKKTYGIFILPHFSVRALGLYRSMTYYQLKAEIAEPLDRDYHRLLSCDNPQVLDEITGRFNIETAVIYVFENNYPVYQTLLDHWATVYNDKYFTVFKKGK